MSYILDALRKAERDRQVARVPTLATAHGDPNLGRWSQWVWAIVAGALVLSAVAFYAMVGAPVRPEPPPVARVAPPAAPAGAPASSADADLASASTKVLERSEPVPAIERPPGGAVSGTPPAAPVAPPAGPPRTARAPEPQRGPSRTKGPASGTGALAQAPPVQAPPAPAQAQAPPAQAPPNQTPPVQAPPAQAPPAAAPAPTQAPPALQTPPGLVLPVPPVPGQSDPNAGPRSGADATAPPPGRARPGVEPAQGGGQPAVAPPVSARLSLDVLVYSDVPAERMVFINGRKYVEGQAVGDDNTVIEQITPEGAVLRQGDKRVVLRPKLNPYSRPGSP